MLGEDSGTRTAPSLTSPIQRLFSKKATHIKITSSEDAAIMNLEVTIGLGGRRVKRKNTQRVKTRYTRGNANIMAAPWSKPAVAPMTFEHISPNIPARTNAV